MNSSLSPLCGAALEEFLNRLEADVSESGDAVALRSALQAQTVEADTLEAIARLHSLWMQAGEPEAARAVLRDDGAALLKGLAAGEKANTAAHLERFRLQIAEYLDDAAAMQDALLALLAIVRAKDAEPDCVALRDWEVLSRLTACAHVDVALKTAELRHALDVALPERASWRAWDDAVYHSRLARVHDRAGNRAQAETAAQKSLAALTQAADDQEIDADDWLRLGNALIEICPDSLPEFQTAIARLTADWSLPRRREAEVRLARLKARALYAQGNLSAALAACEDAHYSLNSWGTGSDDFIEYELPWLIKAGETEKAGERAFQSFYQVQCFENGLEESVCRFVFERLLDPADDSVWWLLCVMRACQFYRTMQDFLSAMPEIAPDDVPANRRALFAALQTLGDRETFDEESDFDPVFQAARALAEASSSGHLWLRRLVVVQDHSAGRVDTQTYLREMEAVVAAGASDKRTFDALYRARVAALGIMATLQCSLPKFESGIWGYTGAAIPEDTVQPALETDAEKAAYAAWEVDFQRAAYEQGRAAMEAYFATGKGHPLDASPHLYSMLCNNLAILYRYDDKRYADAIELHQNGLAASPFAEHYDGIFNCYFCLEDWNNTLRAAEDLWHYTAENGYDRYDPTVSACFCAQSLYELQRANEIPLWLERLTGWQREQGMDENALPENHLHALLVLAYYASAAHQDGKEVARAVWRRVEAQVRNSGGDNELDKDAGNLMFELHQWDDAIYFYERDLTRNGTAWWRQDTETNLAKCHTRRAEEEKSAKPWYKFWK